MTDAIYTQLPSGGSDTEPGGAANTGPGIDGKKFRVDGAVRISGKYVWVSGLYRQKVWVFKK